MRKTIINSFLAIAVIALGYTAMEKLKSQKKKKPSISYKAPKNNFEFIQINNKDLAISFSQQGKVVNKTSINLSPEVAGKVVWAASLNEGQTIRKGQVLYKIDNTSIKLQLKTMKSEFLQQFATILVDLESDFPQRKDIWNNFFNNIKIESTLPQLPSAVNTKEKTFLATRGIYKQYYAIQQQEHISNQHTITSPFDGIITNISAKLGSVITPNSPLLNISKNKSLEIKVALPVQLSSFISLKDKLYFNTDQTGTVNRIESKIDEMTQSINVYIKPSSVSSIKEGTYVSVLFKDIKFPNSSKLPLSTVYDGRNIVQLMKDSTTKSIPISILHKDEQFIYTDNLQNNMIVVKNIGKDFIIGQKVK